MASIITEADGRVRIQFKRQDGKRPSIALGRIDRRTAEEINAHVEHLAKCCSEHKPPLPGTDAWVTELLADPGRLYIYDRLAAVGLVAPREGQRTNAKADTPTPEKLGAFVDAYVAGRTDLKASTVTNMNLVRRRLVEKFGEHKLLQDITPGDADDWRRWLTTKLGDNTTRRYCGRAKQFFRAAVRKRVIPDNPFGDMKGCNVQANRERDFFVDRDVTQKVLDACPDAQWRLLFALSRYGGLRCPSEHMLLKLDDVDWAHDRFIVHSPKTEHHEGKDQRVVPVFPELRPYLEAVWEEAAPGTVYFITRHRKANLRKQLLRILSKAGVQQWPKLFQNLRASRATELAALYPAHIAAAWLGHSEKIAEAHYWRVTDADFQRAATEMTGPACPKAVQNPVQNAPKTPGNQTGERCTANAKQSSKVSLRNALGNASGTVQVTPTGLGQDARSSSQSSSQSVAHQQVDSERSARQAVRQAVGGARGGATDFEAWLDACPTDLPEVVRNGILELVERDAAGLEADSSDEATPRFAQAAS